MTEIERSAVRPTAYSRWHRQNVLRAYFVDLYDGAIAGELAYECSVIDIDWNEYCRHCREPLTLIEVQEKDEPPKPAPVLAALARRANLPAYSVSVAVIADEVRHMRVTGVEPSGAERDIVMTPTAYALFLLAFHWDHPCPRRDGDTLGAIAEHRRIVRSHR